MGLVEGVEAFVSVSIRKLLSAQTLSEISFPVAFIHPLVEVHHDTQPFSLFTFSGLSVVHGVEVLPLFEMRLILDVLQ